MPLDPGVQGLLDTLAAAQRPRLWQLSPPEAREAFIAMVKAMGAKDVPIGATEDGTFPGPAGPLAFRKYTPVSASGPRLPGLIYFHGGGFVLGNLDTHDSTCRLLANASGCRVVSIDYRLAPEHKFPAAVDDAWAATKWVVDHSSDLGIEAKRLAVGGDSAGANLAAVVCQLAKRSGAPKIALQLLLYAVTDASADAGSMRDLAKGYLLEEEGLKWFFGHYGASDPLDQRLSPLRATDFSNLPTAHIHTAEFDPLRDQGKAYADRLQEAGVKVTYVCHSGMIHGFFSLGGVIPYGRAALEKVGAAVKAALSENVPQLAA